MATKCPQCSADNLDTVKFCGECGTLFPDSGRASSPQTRTLHARFKEMTTGTTLADRYQVIEELGRGGMGEVYKVLDLKIKEAEVRPFSGSFSLARDRRAPFDRLSAQFDKHPSLDLSCPTMG